MAIQTLAKGVYVVKPNEPRTAATDYLATYTKAKEKQLELAMAQAQTEYAQSKLDYDQKMAIYNRQLQALEARKAALIDAKATGALKIQELNAKAMQEYEDDSRELATNLATMGSEQVARRRAEVKVLGGGEGGGAGAKGDKLTPEQIATIQGFGQGLSVSDNPTAMVLDKFRQAMGSGGAFSAISDSQRDRALGATVQQAMNYYISQGNTDEEASRLVSSDLAQLGKVGAEAFSAYQKSLPPPEGPARTVYSGGEAMEPKYRGLPSSAKEVLGEAPVGATFDSAALDAEIAKLDEQLKALEIPVMERMDYLERARQLQKERFMRTPYEKFQDKKEAGAAKKRAQMAYEASPEGYLAARAQEAKRLQTNQKELESLLSGVGADAQKIFAANIATNGKSLEESAKKSYDWVTETFSTDPMKREQLHSLMIALYDREVAKKNPAKAKEVESLVVTEAPAIAPPPASDIEAAGAAIKMPVPVTSDTSSMTRPTPQ